MKTVLTFIWIVALLLAAAYVSTAHAATRFEVKQMIVEEAAHSRVPVALVMAVAKVESDFNARALSSAGARGVMQIMPQTARGEFGVEPDALWNPKTNIRLGVRFLERLYDQYDGQWDLALSHYNGGSLKNNRPHARTRKYVAMVQKWQKIYIEQASLWEGPDDQTDDTLIAWYDEDIDTVDLREWRVREAADRYDEDVNTEIIIVERSDRFEPRFYRAPPPPPPPHRRGFGRRPPPRPYFH